MLVMTVFATQMKLSTEAPWDRCIGYAIHYWGAWLVLAPVVLLLAHFLPFRQGHWLTTALSHFSLSVLFVFLNQAIVVFLLAPALPHGFQALDRGARNGIPGPLRPPPPRKGDRSELDFPPPPRSEGFRENHRDFPNEDNARPQEGGPAFFFAHIIRGGLNRMPIWLPIYWILVAAKTLERSNRRLQQREREALQLKARLVQSQLNSLKLQLRPHFLFNALNAISTLVHCDPDKADEMIGNLAFLLRRVIEQEKDDVVPLGEELELLRAYVAIEQVRFGDRFQFKDTVPPYCRKVPLPHMVLQPIVENAFRHGLEPLDREGHVTIAAKKIGDRLQLRIEDDGVGLSEESPKSQGIGLSNARARLEAVFGKEHFQLTMNNRPDGGTIVAIEIPFGTEIPRSATPS